MDPVALKIQALIPLPDYPGNINNWQQAPKYNKISATPAIKIDHSLSPTKKLSFYLNKNWGHTVANGQDGLPIPLTAFRDQRTYTYTTRLNFDASITPKLLRTWAPDSSAS